MMEQQQQQQPWYYSITHFFSLFMTRDYELVDEDGDYFGGSAEHGERFLAGAQYRRPFDYSILAVGVMTLALLIFAETLKHHLDHAAQGKPFFHTVLDGVKEELSTLGIVELIIFLLVKYYEDLNVPRELVFADVHFTIFYTAIFNAFQSVFLAWATWSVSDRLWVQTESLELDHYVELREEFDRLHLRLYPEEDQDSQSTDSDLKNMTAARRGAVESNRKYFTSFEFSGKGFKILVREAWMHVRYPMELSKYRKLLIQVRFHQLRIHFLESNGLPLTLKVSKYLKKAELTVLMKLVHVSAVAWLFLIGALNLMYYILGMVSYVSYDNTTVAVVMKSVFFGCLFGFIFASLLIYNKMKSIFSVIINWRRSTQSPSRRDTNGLNAADEIDEEERGRQEQRNLFWQGDPQLVIALIQVMQFGYALCLAFILIYWQNLKKEAEIAWYLFLICVLVCYTIFVTVMGRVIPQYTLCTSMGHLLRDDHLQHTLAQHELEKAQKEQQRKRLLRAILEQQEGQLMLQGNSCKGGVMFCGSTTAAGTDTIAGNSNVPTGAYTDDMTINTKDSNRAALARAASSARLKSLSSDRASAGAIFQMQQLQEEADKTQLLASLVKTDTSTLRSRLPEEDREMLQHRDMKRSNRKTNSDGVSLMRQSSISFLTGSNSNANDSSSSIKSNSVAASSALDSVDEQKASHLARAPFKERSHDDSEIESSSSKDAPLPRRQLSRADRKESRRSVRTKALSASAIIQSWQDFSVRDTSVIQGGLDPLHEDHCDDEEGEEEKDPLASKTNERIVDMVPPSETKKTSTETLKDDDNDTNNNLSVVVDSVKSVGELSEVDMENDLVISSRGDDKDDNVFVYTPRTWKDDVSDALAQLSPPLMKLKLRRYFLSKQYATVSHVFGSVVVFFLIGNRIEGFLAVEQIIKNSDQTWEVKLNVSFWWQATWYVFFILGSFILLSVIRPTKNSPKSERVAVLGAVIDLLLSGACLTLLVVAEAERCCPDAETWTLKSEKDEDYLAEDPGYRSLAEKKGSYDDDYHPYLQQYYHPPDFCGCSEWGQRTYGGLGKIEPYTGLIALRVFRFVIARRIVQLRKEEDKPEDTSTEGSEGKSGAGVIIPVMDEEAPIRKLLFGDNAAMTHETGSALELWHRAVAKYPHIVTKYGEFSGELFRAMLGLGLEDPNLYQKPIVNDITGRGSEAAKSLGGNTDQTSKKPVQRLKLTGSQYANLPAEAQAIIIAGKLGKPVKESLASDGSKRKEVEFEADTDRMEIEAAGEEEFSTFVAPSARIVRSMRRCDRRWLPLLDIWTAVDVVMTQFEIVYLEVKDEDKADESMKATYLAIQVTKGGKGLRLCDVARGRKIVGHMAMSEITEVHVERDMPFDEVAGNEGEFDVTKPEPRTEYWQKVYSDQPVMVDDDLPVDVTDETPRHQRWAGIKEDRLKLVCENGTLLLRFYTDLEDFEHHPERLDEDNEESGHLTKNIAFQWVQTVGRICGKDQLKECLPHFGDDDSEELRDYLEVVRHDKAGKPQYNRSSSFGDKQQKQFRKSLSFGGDNKKSPRTGYKRSQSVVTGTTLPPMPKTNLSRSVSTPNDTHAPERVVDLLSPTKEEGEDIFDATKDTPGIV